MTGKFLGKYRGMVLNNADPLQLGRIQVQVPDVAGLATTSWAMPCLPVTGLQSGLYMVPPPNAGVWVEFEQGNPDYPIWSGCFFGSAGEVPASALGGPPQSPNIVLQTGSQNSITIQGMPGGGIVLTSGPLANPASPRIMISPTGITISSGQGAVISLSGPSVDINFGALKVT